MACLSFHKDFPTNTDPVVQTLTVEATKNWLFVGFTEMFFIKLLHSILYLNNKLYKFGISFTAVFFAYLKEKLQFIFSFLFVKTNIVRNEFMQWC